MSEERFDWAYEMAERKRLRGFWARFWSQYWFSWRVWYWPGQIWRILTDIPWRLRNLKRFWAAVWFYSCSDYSHTFELFALGLEGIAEHQREAQHAGDWEEIERECKIAAELARRIGGNSPHFYSGEVNLYNFKRKKREPAWHRTAVEYSEMLGNLIRRKARHWWC